MQIEQTRFDPKNYYLKLIDLDLWQFFVLWIEDAISTFRLGFAGSLGKAIR